MDYMTVKQVADLFGVQPRTVRRWCANGQLPGVKIGRQFLKFRRDVIEALGREKESPVPCGEIRDPFPGLDRA